MKSLNVLIVNAQSHEAKQWSNKLSSFDFYVVATVPNLSKMVHTLSHEKAHVVIISSLVLGKNAYKVLKSAMEFFPRTKFVIVGNYGVLEKLNKLTNVVVKNAFDCNLHELFSFPKRSLEVEEVNDTRCRFLLQEHFLNENVSRALFDKVAAKSMPNYAVIVVISNGSARYLEELLCGERKAFSACYVVQTELNKVAVILDKCTTDEKCLDIADNMRKILLERSTVSFSLGVSRIRANAVELWCSYKEALRAAQSFEIFGIESVVHINYLEKNEITHTYPTLKEKALIERTLDGDCATALRHLDDIFKFLNEQASLNKNYINRVALRIWVELNLQTIAQYPAFENAQKESMSFGKLLSCKTTEQVFDFLKDGITAFSEEMREIYNVKRDALFMSMENIASAEENITPEALTRSFGTTLNFLNDAFDRNTDESIFDRFNSAD